MDNEGFMRLAIEKTKEGINHGQTPFGAAIVKDGRIIASAHNEVWHRGNITAHAEMVAIEKACRELDTIDLSGCVIYSTTEPCPMCFSTIHWARISKLYFGARIEDAQKAGFNELTISAETMKAEGGSPVIIVPDFLRDECKELFSIWASKEDKKTY